MSALIWPPRPPGDHDRWSPPDWADQALCAQVDPEIFFPEKGASVRDPKRVCQACEVRVECLEYALAHPDAGAHGIWGGTSERERRILRRSAA